MSSECSSNIVSWWGFDLFGLSTFISTSLSLLSFFCHMLRSSGTSTSLNVDHHSSQTSSQSNSIRAWWGLCPDMKLCTRGVYSHINMFFLTNFICNPPWSNPTLIQSHDFQNLPYTLGAATSAYSPFLSLAGPMLPHHHWTLIIGTMIRRLC